MTSKIITIIAITISLFLGFQCKTEKDNPVLVEGDLYYDWLRWGSFYNQPDSLIEQFKKSIDTVKYNSTDSMELVILDLYNILKKEKLTYSPYIDLKKDNDSIIKIYMTTADYARITSFKRQELIEEKKKVRIHADIRYLYKNYAICTKLISADKVEGQTQQVSRKWKIEDYQ